MRGATGEQTNEQAQKNRCLRDAASDACFLEYKSRSSGWSFREKQYLTLARRSSCFNHGRLAAMFIVVEISVQIMERFANPSLAAQGHPSIYPDELRDGKHPPKEFLWRSSALDNRREYLAYGLSRQSGISTIQPNSVQVQRAGVIRGRTNGTGRSCGDGHAPSHPVVHGLPPRTSVAAAE